MTDPHDASFWAEVREGFAQLERRFDRLIEGRRETSDIQLKLAERIKRELPHLSAEDVRAVVRIALEVQAESDPRHPNEGGKP